MNGRRMAAKAAKLRLNAPVPTWGQLIQFAYEDPPPQTLKLLSPHYSALTALTAQSSAAWSPHLRCCEQKHADIYVKENVDI